MAFPNVSISLGSAFSYTSAAGFCFLHAGCKFARQPRLSLQQVVKKPQPIWFLSPVFFGSNLCFREGARACPPLHAPFPSSSYATEAARWVVALCSAPSGTRRWWCRCVCQRTPLPGSSSQLCRLEAVHVVCIRDGRACARFRAPEP